MQCVARFVLILSIFTASLPGAGASPAQTRIERAQRAIASSPGRADLYDELALAFARRARETSDPAYYDRAEQAVRESLRLKPDGFEALKIRVWCLLGRHEFARALDLARTLNERFPDDVLLYGFLADAHVELGNYEDAEKAAQWMLDLRPGNVPGLTRAAYLRELFGDFEGAAELMVSAFQQTAPSEVEDRAWILTQLAHLEMARGRTEPAETFLRQALELFPDYHYALATLAKVRSAQARHDEAVELLRRHLTIAPHPENRYYLAEALGLAGKTEEAARIYADFEKQARAESDRDDNANRELIFYYVERASSPAEALKIARQEIARRRDVYTLDAYAWVLQAAGDDAGARGQIESALAVGIHNARILYHAGVIALKLGDREAAAKHLKASLDLNPVSEWAVAARETLELATRQPIPSGS
jgi:tetratricopeptide (TPR) repeat protein